MPALCGRDLRYGGLSLDAVARASPERVPAEAYWVVRGQGWLAAIDGDYATTTVALGEHDPLHACVATTMSNPVTDCFVIRRLPALVRTAGFEDVGFRSHGFVETGGGYMLTVVERGADFLLAFGQISDDAAAMLKAEARRRVEVDTFFGHIAYTSLTARKPA